MCWYFLFSLLFVSTQRFWRTFDYMTNNKTWGVSGAISVLVPPSADTRCLGPTLVHLTAPCNRFARTPAASRDRPRPTLSPGPAWTSAGKWTGWTCSWTPTSGPIWPGSRTLWPWSRARMTFWPGNRRRQGSSTRGRAPTASLTWAKTSEMTSSTVRHVTSGLSRNRKRRNSAKRLWKIRRSK